MKIIHQEARMLYPNTDREKVKLCKDIEYAARTCYDSIDQMDVKSYERFLPTLIKNGHDAPLEFGRITLELITSRDVMAEWTRHRLVSNCIQSQRYVQADADGNIPFIRPQFSISTNLAGYGEGTDALSVPIKDMVALWEGACSASEGAYKEMLIMGARKEDARKVLNNSVATKIVTTVNVRELRHILKLRMSSFAYPEMRWLACLIWRQVSTIPIVFDDIRERVLESFGECC